VSCLTDPLFHREALRREFLSQAGFADADLDPLRPDASFRRYFRLTGSGKHWLLMDAPPESENIEAYLRVARHLTGLGLRAPKIGHTDTVNGFALVEDFGNDTFTALLNTGEDATHLYSPAVDLLVQIHQNPQASTIALPSYDLATLMAEALLLPDWFVPLITGNPVDPTARTCYQEIWENALRHLPPPATTLVLRDFHVDNLMRIQGNTPIQQIGLLDFQDALIGPIAYDVLSLLEDARRDLPPSLVEQLHQQYLSAMPLLDVDNFNAWYRSLGAQRHCKVAGIFSRLALRDDKPVYLEHIPRVIALLQQHLNDPLLTPLGEWLDEVIPQHQWTSLDPDLDQLRTTLGLSQRSN